MIRAFVWKYRWLLLGVILVYVVVSLLLFYLTDSPQSVPFEYQVR